MSIIGQWKTKKILFPLEEEIKHYSKEELIEKGVYDESEMGMMFNLILDIKSDGTIESFIKLPAEAVEQARAEGAPVNENGCISMESYTWIEEDGNCFYEVDGQKTHLEINEDGLLAFNMGMTLFEKL